MSAATIGIPGATDFKGNAYCNSGSALHVACLSGHSQIVRLLDNGGTEYDTCMLVATRGGHTDPLRWFLRGLFEGIFFTAYYECEEVSSRDDAQDWG